MHQIPGRSNSLYLQHSLGLEPPGRGIRHRLGGDAEMLVQLFIWRAGAKTAHSDENTFGADDGIPALANCGLDRDLDRRIADHAVPDHGGGFQQQVQARDRHHPRRNAALDQQLARLDGDRDLRSGGKDRCAGL